MILFDPEFSSLLERVWVLGPEDETPARVMVDFILDRCREDAPLVAYVPYTDSADQSEGVSLVATRRGGSYRLRFADVDMGYGVDEVFTAEKLVDKLPEWLAQQFDFLYYLLSK